MRFHLSLLVALGLLSTSCDGTGPLADCNNLGTDDAALAATAVLQAIDDITVEADMLASELASVCSDMAADLGVSVPAPLSSETQREAACGAVAAEIRAILEEAEVALTVDVIPARCSFSVDGYAECVAECDANVSADVDVRCTEGELSGMCSGSCSGSCTLEGNVACDGVCRGTCSGTCSGVCNGACDGTCSVVDAAGNCVGTCEGTCMGSCSASCSGMCEGSCVADVSGSCEGTCRGSCDVDYVAPRCDGKADVDASVDCTAACDADLQVDAICSEPEVTISLDGTGGERVAALIAALQTHWSRFRTLETRITAATAAARDLVDSARDLRDATFRAVICFGLAVDDAIAALASFEVSVTVTVEVSASVVVE